MSDNEFVLEPLNNADFQYHTLLEAIMQQPERGDRTGTGTRSLFGYQMRFSNLDKEFPLITTKKVHMKSIIYELLWMLKGDTNIKYLKDNGVTIWDEWADENGELGPVYGSQWRAFNSGKSVVYDNISGARDFVPVYVDQIKLAIDSLRNNPENRRNIVSAWNPPEVPNMRLPPCHMMFQFYTRTVPLNKRRQIASERNIYPIDDQLTQCGVPERYLDCQVYMRSWDVFLGGPFNIAQYALLVHLIAKTVNMVPGELVVSSGDTHIYSNHYEQVKEQLSRASAGKSPRLEIIGDAKEDPADYEYDQIKLHNYISHATIKADVAI